MRKKKTKTSRREWTKADLRTLRANARRKRAALIARMLRRSEGATRQKAFSEGISLAFRRAA